MQSHLHRLIPEMAFYKSFTRRSTIVLAERLGGVVGLGNPPFTSQHL